MEKFYLVAYHERFRDDHGNWDYNKTKQMIFREFPTKKEIYLRIAPNRIDPYLEYFDLLEILSVSELTEEQAHKLGLFKGEENAEVL